MMAYNQPPHPSYFLGEMEGITQAPPPLTNSGRTEISNGGTISTTTSHLLLAETGDMNVTVAATASPYMLTDNAPSWTQGHDNNSNITTTIATHTLNGGTLAGTMRLVKQGGGVLVLPKATHTFTGKTEVWGGTLRCDGTLSKSAVWLNRFATLESDGGTFSGGITMDYGAELHPGGRGKIGTLKTSTLTMNMGARLVLDVNDDTDPDVFTANTLVINKVNWAYGPKYLAPVLEFVYQGGGALPDGTYLIGNVGTVTGSLDDLIVEGLGGATYQLKHVSGKLQIVVGTGVSNRCPMADITPIDYAVHDGVILPTVGITVPAFTYNGNSVTPNVSAIFTDEDGTTTDASYYVFYDENYENATDVIGWTNSGAPMSIGSDNEHGRYLAINTGNTNTRYTYCVLDASVDVSAVDAYTVEFDLAMKFSNKESVEFCVMSRGGVMPNNVWDNYAVINGNANMLFDITAPSYSTTYTVNGTATTTDLPAETWYHYTLQVDRIARQVTWSISNGSNGTFALPDGTSADIAGFYIVAARYYSAFKLDNIKICTNELSSYTFTRPGTLTITTSYPGCRSAHATYVATGIETGDANGDGLLSIADVTTVAAHLLGRTSPTFIFAAADANGDGKVDSADVLAIVGMIIN